MSTSQQDKVVEQKEGEINNQQNKQKEGQTKKQQQKEGL